MVPRNPLPRAINEAHVVVPHPHPLQRHTATPLLDLSFDRDELACSRGKIFFLARHLFFL